MTNKEKVIYIKNLTKISFFDEICFYCKNWTDRNDNKCEECKMTIKIDIHPTEYLQRADNPEINVFVPVWLRKEVL